jgi:antitoxin PrlF
MNAPVKIETGRMTSKGQIFVSKATREAVGLKPNAPYKLIVNADNQLLVAPLGFEPEEAEERARNIRKGLAMLRGTGKSGMTTEEIMRDLRGDWEP